MGKTEPSDPAPPGSEPEAPGISFVYQEDEWIARVSGSGASGRARPGAGAPLMLVTFARAQSPGTVVLEVLEVGRGLEGLNPDQLVELIARARPAQPPKEREDIFSDTRARKRGER